MRLPSLLSFICAMTCIKISSIIKMCQVCGSRVVNQWRIYLQKTISKTKTFAMASNIAVQLYFHYCVLSVFCIFVLNCSSDKLLIPLLLAAIATKNSGFFFHLFHVPYRKKEPNFLTIYRLLKSCEYTCP